MDAHFEPSILSKCREVSKFVSPGFSYHHFRLFCTMSFPTPLAGCPDNLKVDMSKTELVISYKPVPFITFPISSVGNPIPASAQ